MNLIGSGIPMIDIDEDKNEDYLSSGEDSIAGDDDDFF